MADQEQPSGTEPVTNIVLVGRTGNGKSATGNTLLAHPAFTSRKQAVGVTMECQQFRAAIKDGPIINVIDTPGLFDLSVSAEFLSKEIIKCLTMAKEGIHAVLFVLSVKTRISEEEEATLNALQRIFESKILEYFIVVFTGGDELEADKQTLDDYLSQGVPEFLEKVLRLCGRRKILFDNRTENREKKAEQVKQLLALVADVQKKNGGIPYTDQMHSQIKAENDKLTEQQREIESKNLAESEMAAMKESTRIEYEQKMNMMAQMVEKTLKLSAESHERQMGQLTEIIHQGQRQQVQERRNLRPVIECNIM